MQVPIEIVKSLDDGNLPCGKISWGGGVKSRILFTHGTYDHITSLDNLFIAWKAYRRGKRKKGDIQLFESRLEDNIFDLHEKLVSGRYRPGTYQRFKIIDPKVRLISKASVCDRLLHQAIYQVLYPGFDKTFIYDSYSCRNGKGSHKGFARLVSMSRRVSNNYTSSCWAIKLDIKKFFDSVDHEILKGLLRERIEDEKLLNLLDTIIESFSMSPGRGMPLGNLTSQLFASIYMNPLDQYVKRKLNAKYYLRYADDFILLSADPSELMGYFVETNKFLKDRLRLNIHPDKVEFRKLEWGIDFIGYIALPHYQLPRRKTLKRIFRKIAKSDKESLESSLPSYLGYVKHVSSYRTRKEMKLLAEVTHRSQ